MALVLALAGPSFSAQRVGLAIAAFDFRDTSGEIRDQTAEHEARLDRVVQILRERLVDDGSVEPTVLACPAERCSARRAGLQALSEEAKAAGANYLLIGEMHKMSTLVGWMKFAVLDLARGKAACDRFLTYRGDTDEAWRRAAEFAARTIREHCLPD